MTGDGVREHRRTGLRAATDLVERSDRATVIAAWERAQDEGDTVVHARLRDHENPTPMHFVDARAELGVFLMIYDVDEGGGRVEVPEVPPAPEGSRAKVVRSRKDGLAVLVEIDPNVTRRAGCRGSRAGGRWRAGGAPRRRCGRPPPASTR